MRLLPLAGAQKGASGLPAGLWHTGKPPAPSGPVAVGAAAVCESVAGEPTVTGLPSVPTETQASDAVDDEVEAAKVVAVAAMVGATGVAGAMRVVDEAVEAAVGAGEASTATTGTRTSSARDPCILSVAI